MKKKRSDAIRTRLNLLDAAGEVFGQKGFWNATVEDICKKANANVAAINYHFGNKENLYVEAWKYSFEKSMIRHPPDGGVGPDEPIEKRLEGRILSILGRIIDPETHDIDLIHKEFSNPTGLLIEVAEKKMTPVVEEFKSLLREYLGKDVEEELLDFCHRSVMSQAFAPMMHLRPHNHNPLAPKPNLLPLNLGVEKLANYITKFILTGLKSFRNISE